MVKRLVGQVLGLVVVEAAGHLDANGRQRAVAKYRQGKFVSRHKTLGHHPSIEGGGLTIGGFEFITAVDDADADGRTLMDRLDHQRQTQSVGHLVPVRFGRQQHALGRRQTQGLPQRLGPELVHAQRRGQHTAAGIGDSRQLQGPLQTAVLPSPAVQGNEHQIGVQRLQPGDAALGKVIASHFKALALTRRQHGGTAVQRHFSFGAMATVDDHHMAVGLYLSCHRITSSN